MKKHIIWKNLSISMCLIIIFFVLPYSSYAASNNILSGTLLTKSATAESSTIPEKRQYKRVVDNADILNESEEKSLVSKVNEISERQKFDIAIVTVNSLEGKSPTEYADDFFDYNGYGIGENKDGILFLISMNEHGWAISTHGHGITAFTDAGQKYIMDNVTPSLSEGKYEDAFSLFSDYCDDYLTQAATGQPYDSGNLPKGTVSPIWILGDLCIGAVIAFIILSAWKKELLTVKMQNSADDYIVPDSFKLTDKNDVFLYETVTKVERSKESDSSSGSSTHTSSSGETHGGSSGSF